MNNIELALNRKEKFLLKVFPRLVYISIAIDPIADKYFPLWLYMICVVTFFVTFGLECICWRKLCHKYDEKVLNRTIINIDIEYKYDLAISILGFAVCYFTHSGTWWIFLTILLLTLTLKFCKPIKHFVSNIMM